MVQWVGGSLVLCMQGHIGSGQRLWHVQLASAIVASRLFLDLCRLRLSILSFCWLSKNLEAGIEGSVFH